MVHCSECGGFSPSGRVVKDFHGHLDDKPFEVLVVCPLCGGSVEEASVCPCGEPTADGGLCVECKRKAVLKFEKFLYQELSDVERAFLNKVYDGREF